MKVEYRENNSAGYFRLTDHEYRDLERHGWYVEWSRNTVTGRRAKRACKDFQRIRDALDEFEAVTGQDVTDEGCNCCGPPHIFHWTGRNGSKNASGEELLGYLYTNVPKTFREACELLNKDM